MVNSLRHLRKKECQLYTDLINIKAVIQNGVCKSPPSVFSIYPKTEDRTFHSPLEKVKSVGGYFVNPTFPISIPLT